MLNKIILPLWIAGSLALLLYSFTQVDLSLTLSEASFWQFIQRSFQYIGWFNRPLSTILYCFIVVFLFALYCWTLWLIKKKKIAVRVISTIIICVSIILLPSYNAFSYDLFNYIFDARIVTHYGLSPYDFKALDFAGDPMLSFMRSTHRVYPYGPTWLGVTVPLAFIGNEVFLFTFYLFKTLGIASFLGTVYFLKKTAEKIDLKNPSFAVAMFALNPLVIVESLVSSHNEAVMMFFATMGLYFLLDGRRTISFISLLVSIGIKYATASLLPIYFLKLFFKKITNSQLIFTSLILMVFAVGITSLASGQNKEPEFQPWYLLMIAPFISLYENKMLRTLFIFVSIAGFFTYIPFIYGGVWPENIVNIKNIILGASLLFGFITYTAIKLKKT